MDVNEILAQLKAMSNPESLKGMSKYGINVQKALGVSVPNMRNLAKKVGKNHQLALALWQSGIHEAMILATMIDDPNLVTEQQMDDWVQEFNSWDLCDQCCLNLFDKTKFAYNKIYEWSSSDQEYVKRASFALMSVLAWHDKAAPDSKFEKFFPIIKREASDQRNYVKKSVNWALRQIGKRNVRLNGLAVKVAKEIEKIDSKSAKWIARDAIKELTSDSVRDRLQSFSTATSLGK